MGRRKRRFTDIVDAAEKRLAGLVAIDPELDLGNGLSITNYNEQLTLVKERIVNYNSALSAVDKESNAIDASLKVMREFNRRILAAIGAVYGYDSSEYEMVGGTRVSDIKRVRKPDLDPELPPLDEEE